MSTSLKSIRQQLLSMRAWHSEGKTLDKKINDAVNQALDRLAGDVPEALVPDEQHVVLQRPYTTGQTGGYVVPHPTDKRLLVFVDKNGLPLDSARTSTTWRPRCTGEWDGIMHIEVKDPRGRWHRRQCREFFYLTDTPNYRLSFQNVRATGKATFGQIVGYKGLVAEADALNKYVVEGKKVLRRNYGYVATQKDNGVAEAKSVEKLIESLFSREGDAALSNLKVRDGASIQEQIAFAEKNGLNVNELDEQFVSQVYARARSTGSKFVTYNAYGTGPVVNHTLERIFGGEVSYDSTVRYATRAVNNRIYFRNELRTDDSIYTNVQKEIDYTAEGALSKNENFILSKDLNFENEDFEYRLTGAVRQREADSLNLQGRVSRGPVTIRNPARIYMVTLDRPWINNTDGYEVEISASKDSAALEALVEEMRNIDPELYLKIIKSGLSKDLIFFGHNSVSVSFEPLEFRIYQPEFFLRDDVTELHEPAVVYDETEQQVWAIDTAGADRAGMRDFQGDTEGRPVRMYRGRHFQLPAPTEAPKVRYSAAASWLETQVRNTGSSPTPYTKGGKAIITSSVDAGPFFGALNRGSVESLKQGTWSICYTYVWGRRDKEWQQSPNIAPNGHRGMSPEIQINWAHRQGLVSSLGSLFGGPETSTTGIHDPTWESAPSPVATVSLNPASVLAEGAIQVQATNIDAMMGFSDPGQHRFGRTGMRLRFYVSHRGYGNNLPGGPDGAMANTETNDKFYLLCEVEPTYDFFGDNPQAGCSFLWTGNCLYDIERPLRHSTGYYAYRTYPAQDARYELDLRVSRLPGKLIDDQDTPPIQRDAVPALVELAAYYVALLDGADQSGAQVHLDRYESLTRKFRARYANPAKIVEPTSIIGGTPYRSRFNLFGNFKS